MTTNNSVNSPLSGTTGTGQFVGSNNPTIGAPLIQTALLDSNSNIWITQGANLSAVNNVEIFNASTGTSPTISAVGSDSNVTLLLAGKGTGGVAVQGTGTNNSSSAGYVGEYVTSNIPFASATSLSNGTAKNVTSISLTAGDWDISGNIFFNGIGITNPSYYAWTSTASATLPDNSLVGYSATVIAVTAIAAGLTCPFLRVSIASTTTVYLSAQANFTAGSATACGSIFARRAR